MYQHIIIYCNNRQTDVSLYILVSVTWLTSLYSNQDVFWLVLIDVEKHPLATTETRTYTHSIV